MKHKFLSKRYWDDMTTPMSQSASKGKAIGDVINFGLGDPDFTTHEYIIEKAMEDAKAGHTHYTEAFGDPELIKEISKYYQEDYGMNVAKEEIMVTTSGCHAMWLTLEAILDDGDEVIIPTPFFTPYQQQIKLCRGKAVFLPTYEEEEFGIIKERLESIITNKTKAIIINTPHNPTGTIYPQSMLEEIKDVAIRYDLLIISDDVYTAFSFDNPFIPMASLDKMRERTITIGTFSKNYAMTGWRIGYVIAPRFLIQTIKNINENNVFTAPSISQRAAIYALRERKKIVPEIVAEVKERLAYAYQRISQISGLRCLKPKGSIYLFVNIKETGMSSQMFCQVLFEQARIVAIPGTAFGTLGEGYVRLAMTISKEQMKEAFDRMSKMDIFHS